MQYRGECWGGNSMGKHGKRPDSECNMKCKKDNSRMCGAGWRNNIFKLVVTNLSLVKPKMDVTKTLEIEILKL